MTPRPAKATKCNPPTSDYVPVHLAATRTQPHRPRRRRIKGQKRASDRRHYNYFRDYEPQTGRYVESDPIGLRGGVSTYAYVESRPVLEVDPRGLQTWKCERDARNLPPPITHAFLCTTNPNKKDSPLRPCGGQAPSCGPLEATLGSCPGTDSHETYNPFQCTQVMGPNECYQKCMVDEFKKPRPDYSTASGLGTNCFEWVDETLYKCAKQCGLPLPLY